LSAVLTASATIGCFALIGFAGAAQAQVTLGPAAQFALLADDGALDVGNHTLISGPGGNIGATYNDISIGGNNTDIIGNAVDTVFGEIMFPPATITLLNYAHVVGTCVTDGGDIILNTGATCTHQVMDPTDTNPNIVLLGEAVDQEEVFDAAVLCQQPTQSVTINLAAGKTKTITDTTALNVITAPNITLGNSAVLTLSGNSTDIVILETTGPITIGDSAKIVLAGGLVPQNVWISSTTEFVGFHKPATPPTTMIGNSAVINGTIHGGETCSLGTGVTFNGALICDYGITAGANLTMNFKPATGISLPGPGCP